MASLEILLQLLIMNLLGFENSRFVAGKRVLNLQTGMTT
jgi:hypothetical protein